MRTNDHEVIKNTVVGMRDIRSSPKACVRRMDAVLPESSNTLNTGQNNILLAFGVVRHDKSGVVLE